MKKMYYVRTNAYDCIITDDGECRRAYDNLTGDLYAGTDSVDINERAALILSELSEYYDDSGWDIFEESIEELTDDSTILAVIDVE